MPRRTPWIIVAWDPLRRRCVRCGAVEVLAPGGELLAAWLLRARAFLLEHGRCRP